MMKNKGIIYLLIVIGVSLTSMGIFGRYTKEGYGFRMAQEREVLERAKNAAAEYAKKASLEALLSGSFGLEAQEYAKKYEEMLKMDMAS